MAKSTITIDVVSNFKRIVDVRCVNMECKFHSLSGNNCNFKELTITADGRCWYFEKIKNTHKSNRPAPDPDLNER